MCLLPTNVRFCAISKFYGIDIDTQHVEISINISGFCEVARHIVVTEVIQEIEAFTNTGDNV